MVPNNNYINMGSMQPQGGQQVSNIQYPSYVNNPTMGVINQYDNYIGRPPIQINQTNQFLKCRPVASKEEAMAAQIDLDGSLWVFINTPNGKIYTKQINNDGTAAFKTYTLTQNENPYNSKDYVTKEEFNQVVQSIMAAITPASNIGGTTAIDKGTEQQKSMDF